MTTKVRIIYFNNDTDSLETTSVITGGDEKYQDIRHDVLGLIEQALQNLPKHASVVSVIFDGEPKVYPLR